MCGSMKGLARDKPARPGHADRPRDAPQRIRRIAPLTGTSWVRAWSFGLWVGRPQLLPRTARHSRWPALVAEVSVDDRRRVEPGQLGVRLFADGAHRCETGAGAAGLSPQGGFGVGSRQPSDPCRRPQHRGHGQKRPARRGHQRCGVGPVRPDCWRKSPTIRAHGACGVALVGVEQDVLGLRASSRRTASTNPYLDVSCLPNGSRPRSQRRPGQSRCRVGEETKRFPQTWAGPRRRSRWSPGEPFCQSEGTRR